jgi:hypothetical protein
MFWEVLLLAQTTVVYNTSVSQSQTAAPVDLKYLWYFLAFVWGKLITKVWTYSSCIKTTEKYTVTMHYVCFTQVKVQRVSLTKLRVHTRKHQNIVLSFVFFSQSRVVKCKVTATMER